MKQLLKGSVDVNSRTEDVRLSLEYLRLILLYTPFHCLQEGDTALILAALRGHVEVVRLLLEANAKPNVVDKVNMVFSCLLNTV